MIRTLRRGDGDASSDSEDEGNTDDFSKNEFDEGVHLTRASTVVVQMC